MSSQDKRNKSKRQSRNTNSLFEFKHVSFVVGKSKKYILKDVSGRVESGQMLAILGPSGAGKTSLLKALSLGINSGKVYGKIKLNGQPWTSRQFKKHCFLVEQYDHHWPFLTCRETLTYAAELLLGKGNHIRTVDKIIKRMGLKSCEDTIAGHDFKQGLSGGQKRRLSIAIALLKKPSVIMLDEPTSGLDAAGAVAIVRELRDLAQKENLIIISTIHQPSNKAYNCFDQVMLMSRGKQAYMGNADRAVQYFDSIGYPNEDMINPAEFLLDLVNADFNSDSFVENILKEWKRNRYAEKAKTEEKLVGSSLGSRARLDFIEKRPSYLNQFSTLLRRHALLIRRDPFLYIGRAVTSFLGSNFFALVYFNARIRSQEQSSNFVNANLWFISLNSLLAVVAVYELNREFKSVSREVKNGMLSPGVYMIAKSLLVVPVMLLFGVCGITTAGYGILRMKTDYFSYLIIFSIASFVFECLAEVFSVMSDNPLMGMLQFLGVWFSSFLFAGMFIPREDIPVVIRWIYYVLPFAPLYSTIGYHVVIGEDWESCTSSSTDPFSLCIDLDQFPFVKSGVVVLNALQAKIPFLTPEDRRFEFMAILLSIGLYAKSMYTGLVLYKTSRATQINPIL